MLDGRVLEASQVQYKPFGKPSLQREIAGMQGFPALNSPHDLIQKCSMADSCCRNIATKLRATCRHRSRAKPLNPLSPSSLLCYVLYLTRQAAEPPLLTICTICAIYSVRAKSVLYMLYRGHIAHIVHIAWTRGGVDVQWLAL